MSFKKWLEDNNITVRVDSELPYLVSAYDNKNHIRYDGIESIEALAYRVFMDKTQRLHSTILANHLTNKGQEMLQSLQDELALLHSFED